jgi:hypothetical protein
MFYSTNVLIHNLKKAITGIFSVHVIKCALKFMINMLRLSRFDIKCVEISYICTQQFWNDTSTLQIGLTRKSSQLLR